MESAYGFHLVLVDRVETGTLPDLDFVADRLRLEIEEERREANLEALISDLRTRYEVRLPSAAGSDAGPSKQETG